MFTVQRILIYILSGESQSHVKGEIPLQRRPALNEFFSLLMKVRRESHLFFCDNLSLSPVISFAPLILIVLYNCVMWTSWSLKSRPYPFIITWCLEPLFIFSSTLLCAIHCWEQLKGSSFKGFLVLLRICHHRDIIYLFMICNIRPMLAVYVLNFWNYSHIC